MTDITKDLLEFVTSVPTDTLVKKNNELISKEEDVNAQKLLNREEVAKIETKIAKLIEVIKNEKNYLKEDIVGVQLEQEKLIEQIKLEKEEYSKKQAILKKKDEIQQEIKGFKKKIQEFHKEYAKNLKSQTFTEAELIKAQKEMQESKEKWVKLKTESIRSKENLDKEYLLQEKLEVKASELFTKENNLKKELDTLLCSNSEDKSETILQPKE